MLQDVSGQQRRVALVTGGLKLGGGTTFLCNLGGELVRRGNLVEVLSFEKENPLASDFRRLNLPVLALDDRRLIFEDRVRLILEGLKRFQPDVVLANLSATSFEVLRYVPQGVFRVGMGISDHPQVYDMLRYYAPYMDLLGVVSQGMKEKAEALPEFRNTPVRYLPFGVPMPNAPFRDFMGPLKILYVGRLERAQKRVHLFPAVLDRLKLSGIPFHWTIAGDGAERPALEAEMKGRPPDQTISFPGKISYSNVPKLLAEHDIFLLASDHEGMPLSLLEAMGLGMVPVVSDLESGIRELVDETTGKRVPPSETAVYANAIIWLHQHRDEMRRFSENGQQRVRELYSISAMTDRWLAVLPSVAKSHSPWPERFTIHPPLPAAGNWKFSALGRLMRRAAFKLRARHV